jgi:hypothetical protein
MIVIDQLKMLDLDTDDFIEVSIEKSNEDFMYTYIDVSEAVKLINFLQEQVDNFNNKTK